MIPRADQTPEQRAMFAERRRERDRLKRRKWRDEVRAAKGLTKKAPVKTWTAQETELAEALLAEKSTNEMCLAALGRTKRCCESRIQRVRFPATTGYYAEEKRVQIPHEVLEDRNHRLMARMTMDLTGMLMGDPPIPAKASSGAMP